MRLDVGVELREIPPFFLELEIVLFGLDPADELVAAHLDLGAPLIVLRVEQIQLVLRRLDFRIGLQLDQLLVGFSQLGFGLLQVVLLRGAIELDHDIAFSHHGARRTIAE